MITHIVASMNQEQFLVELKERQRLADCHRRYYADRAKTFNRADYWLRGIIGVTALIGVGLSSNKDWREVGAMIAGGCAVVTTSLFPLFKWDSIVTGFNDAEDEWMRIFNGYNNVLSYFNISDRGEILVQEFQRVKEMQSGSALSDKKLPYNHEKLRHYETEVRNYHKEEDEESS